MLFVLLLSSLARAAEWPTPDVDPAPWSQLGTGVELQDRVIGSGEEVVRGSTVSVLYTGMLADGTVFDSTANRGDQPFSYRAGGGMVIPGWDAGVLGMRVGGVRRLKIPADQGYGSRDMGAIPPDSVLYFEIAVKDVVPPRSVPAQTPIDPAAWTELDGGVRYADVTVGDGKRPKRSHRVCVDWVAWKGEEVVEETYTRERCTWMRLNDGNLPQPVELAIEQMRVDGVCRVADGERTWQVALSSTAK